MGLSNVYGSWKEQLKEPSATTFLILLLIVDFAYIFWHFQIPTSIRDDSLFSVEKDLGYPEFYQYAKEVWIAVLFIMVFLKTKIRGYVIWTLFFTYLLLDDALSIHEEIGTLIAGELPFSPLFGLRLQDFGELAVTGIFVAIFAPLLLYHYVHGISSFQQVTRHVISILILLALFGILADMLVIIIKEYHYFYYLLGGIEDGGEMLVMSLIVWYVFLLNVREGDISISLW